MADLPLIPPELFLYPVPSPDTLASAGIRSSRRGQRRRPLPTRRSALRQAIVMAAILARCHAHRP